MKTTNYLYILTNIFVISCSLPNDAKESEKSGTTYPDILQLERQVREDCLQDKPTSKTEHARINAGLQNTATEMNDWMKNLPDTALISVVNLPGSNKSWNTGYETDATSTQSLTVERQLKAGIRALDIRCYNYKDVFATYYMETYINRMFSTDIRDVCLKFLQEHPSEFILMMITPRGPDELCTRSFGETLKAYTQGVEKYFYLTENIPQVKDVRGKIVILRSCDNLTGEPLGNKIIYRENNIYTSETTITARIQNYDYVPTVFHRWGKWINILTLLNEADGSSSEQTTFYLNFTNAYSPGCYPYTTAGYINPLIQKYLYKRNPDYPHRYGAIMMDFVGYYTPEVIKTIAESNTQ